MDTKLEVVIVPVSDVDRAKQFYTALGWREDIDLVAGDDFRVVQLTPPGSACSITFGTDVTTASPGSLQGFLLVVSDIEAARAELVEHGASVSEVFHGPRGRFHPTTPVCGCRGRTPNAAATSRTRCSATRTATAGCSRRSPHACPRRDPSAGPIQ